MRNYSLLLSIFLFCSLSNYHLTFEIVKKSGKDYPKINGKNEFHFLENPVDTSKSIFVAEVKLTGEDVTVVELYAKLRQESQNLGANSFQVLHHAKDNDSYYLLCTIFRTDTATLHARKKNDADNGKIFVISAEPAGYLRKEDVTVNDSLKFTLISGTYRPINADRENENYRIVRKQSKIQLKGNKNQVNYVSTRLVKYNITQTVSYYTSSGQKVPAVVKKKIKSNVLENALGKLMLVFYKPAGTK